MATTQKQRGKKAATGPRGAAGKTGPSGAKGGDGARGLRGATGIKGEKGSTGARGRAGRSAIRTPQLGLAGVYNHIERIYQELDIHLKRIGQLQTELNKARTTFQLMAESK